MNDDILQILDNIKKVIDNEGITSIYKGNNKLWSSNQSSLSKIVKELKDNFNDIPRETKVYAIIYSINKKWKPSKWSYGPFVVNISQYTLTKDLNLKKNDDDKGQTITYTIEELTEIGFKLSQVKKIIKAVKNKAISFVPFKKITITDVLNSSV